MNGASRGVARNASSSASRTPASNLVEDGAPSIPSARSVSGTSAAPTAPTTARRSPSRCRAVNARLSGKRCWRTVTAEKRLSVGARTPAVAATPSQRHPAAARTSKPIAKPVSGWVEPSTRAAAPTFSQRADGGGATGGGAAA